MNTPDSLVDDGDVAQAARRVVKLIRNNSPVEVGDAELCHVLLVAAGLCRAGVAFPSMAIAMGSTGIDGALFAAGVRIGFHDRINLEKESCEGAA